MLSHLKPPLTPRERVYSFAIYLVGPLVSLLDTLTILISASVISLFLNQPRPSASDSFLPTFAFSTGTTLGLFVFVFISRTLLRVTRIVAESNLRRMIYGRIAMATFEQQIIKHGRANAGRDSGEMIRDLDAIPSFIGSFFFSRFILFEESVLVCGIALVLLSQSTPGAIVILLCGGGLVLIMVKASSQALERAGAEAVQHRGRRLRFSLFIFRSIREIILYGKQRYAATYFGLHLKKALDAERRFEITSRVSPVIIESIIVFSGATILWLTSAVLNESSKALSIGIVLTLGAFRLIPGLSRFAHALQDRRFARPQAEILMSYLREASEINTPKKSPSHRSQSAEDAKDRKDEFLEEVNVSIHFQNVSFTYSSSGTPVLENLSHHFSHGLFHVVRGESGRGKTTLLSLIMGFVDPQQGQVLVNGIPIRDSLQSNNHQIGYVPQAVTVADYPLANNITLIFDESVPTDYSRLQLALQMSGLSEFTSSLPDGLDTPLGELGSRASGGQLQRIGLARALYRNPKILLLDEFTSNLDYDTESRILQDVVSLKNKILIIAVSHSSHVAQYADNILKL